MESTTPDLVELVREQVEALDRGDFDGVMSSLDLSYPVRISTVSSIGPRVKVLSLCVNRRVLNRRVVYWNA